MVDVSARVDYCPTDISTPNERTIHISSVIIYSFTKRKLNNISIHPQNFQLNTPFLRVLCAMVSKLGSTYTVVECSFAYLPCHRKESLSCFISLSQRSVNKTVLTNLTLSATQGVGGNVIFLRI